MVSELGMGESPSFLPLSRPPLSLSSLSRSPLLLLSLAGLCFLLFEDPVAILQPKQHRSTHSKTEDHRRTPFDLRRPP